MQILAILMLFVERSDEVCFVVDGNCYVSDV